mmetsp:Transcript_13620/g.22311  ORF Transcript_13620/g.22311 Transcript_13620/m.22311 type:complete len:107 (-) Transcript_13620:645-965(-)
MGGNTTTLGYLKSLSEFLLTINEEVDAGDETGGNIIGFGANVGHYLISREGIEGYRGDFEGDCFEDWVDLLDWLGGVILFVGGSQRGGSGGYCCGGRCGCRGSFGT